MAWGGGPQVGLSVCCLIACNAWVAWDPVYMNPALRECKEAVRAGGPSLGHPLELKKGALTGAH